MKGQWNAKERQWKEQWKATERWLQLALGEADRPGEELSELMLELAAAGGGTTRVLAAAGGVGVPGAAAAAVAGSGAAAAAAAASMTRLLAVLRRRHGRLDLQAGRGRDEPAQQRRQPEHRAAGQQRRRAGTGQAEREWDRGGGGGDVLPRRGEPRHGLAAARCAGAEAAGCWRLVCWAADQGGNTINSMQEYRAKRLRRDDRLARPRRGRRCGTRAPADVGATRWMGGSCVCRGRRSLVAIVAAGTVAISFKTATTLATPPANCDAGLRVRTRWCRRNFHWSSKFTQSI